MKGTFVKQTHRSTVNTSLSEICKRKYLGSDSSPLLPFQLHGDDRVLAPKAGAAALLLRAGVSHLRHLLQLQRRALRPAQHHLRQHRQDEPLPFPPCLLQYHRFLHFVFPVRPLHLHIPAKPVPPLLPRGARLLHLREEFWGKNDRWKKDSETEKESKEESSEVMKNYCMYLPNTGHCMLRKNHSCYSLDCSLNVHRPSTFDVLKHPRMTLSTSANLSDLSSTPGSMRSACLCPIQDNYQAQELPLEAQHYSSNTH